jgi:lipopolysaccharide transport system ATP-binding protein
MSIEFPVFGVRSRSFKSSILNTVTGGEILKDDSLITIKAIDDVSFSLEPGDRVGLIGHNGSGKTTLLRAMAGVYFPTKGLLNVEGSISSLLDIFLGMDMDATGRENIVTRGLIMGFTFESIIERVNEIATFSGLGEFIDLPMRTYSSGMAMRLAFAASTSFDANIVLMDEWLSVGDENFSRSSERRIKKLIDRAEIVVFASHDHKLLKNICNKTIVMNGGKIESII